MSVSDQKNLRRAVFLDRDGVLNNMVVRDGLPHPVDDIADVKILPGVVEACQKLAEAGFLLICVTNQPDVSRGLQTRERVETVNNLIRSSLLLDDLRVCWHDNQDHCNCRKPKPGMLLDAARDFGIDLKQSFMVGDRRRDIEAGQNAGCRTVFVDHGYREKVPETADLVVHSLFEAVPWLLSQ